MEGIQFIPEAEKTCTTAIAPGEMRNSADTKFSGEGEGGGAQPPEQIFLQPAEVRGGAEIHLQPLEGDHVKAGCLKEAMTLWEIRTSLSGPMEKSPCWSRFGGSTWDPVGTHTEQDVKNCSLGTELTLEKFVQDCVLGKGPCAGAKEKSVRSGPPEEKE